MFDGLAIGDYFLNLLRAGVLNFISGRYAGLTDAFHTVFSVGLILSFMIQGFKVMGGDIQKSPRQMAVTAIWILVAIPITAPTTYYDFIFFPFFTAKDNLSLFLYSGNLDDMSIYAATQSSFYRMMSLAGDLISQGGVTELKPVVMGCAIGIIFGVYFFVLLGVTLFNEFALGIVLALGGIIIPLSAFPSCRGVLKSWIIDCLKYAAFCIVVAVIISILSIIMDELVAEVMRSSYDGDEATVDGSWTALFATLTLGAFGIYMMFKASEIAQALTGGVMSDGASGVSAITNGVTNTINTGSNLASIAAKSGNVGAMALKAAKGKLGG